MSGLYQMRARFYSPVDGRFLSRDPYAMGAAQSSQHNCYVYGANNPVNGVDPSGELFIERVSTDKMNEEQREKHAKFHAGTDWAYGEDLMALRMESIFSAFVDGVIIATTWSAMRLEQQLTNPNFTEGNLHQSVMAIGTVYHLNSAENKGYIPGSIIKAISMNSKPKAGTCRWSDISFLLDCPGLGCTRTQLMLTIVTGMVKSMLHFWPGSDALAIRNQKDAAGPCDGALPWKKDHAEILVARWSCNTFALTPPVPHRMLDIVTSKAACDAADGSGEPCLAMLPRLKTMRLPMSGLLYETTLFVHVPRHDE